MTRMTAAETNEMQGRKKLTVLAWPLRSPANRYPETLYMHLPNVDAHDFVAGRSGLKAIFRRKYDVFHIHWLERAFWRGGRIRSDEQTSELQSLMRISYAVFL